MPRASTSRSTRTGPSNATGCRAGSTRVDSTICGPHGAPIMIPRRHWCSTPGPRIRSPGRRRAVRAEAIRGGVARARALAGESADQRLAMRGMRHLQLDGPHRERPIVTPPGVPAPDTLLALEESLTAGIEAMARRIEIDGPD